MTKASSPVFLYGFDVRGGSFDAAHYLDKGNEALTLTVLKFGI